MKRKEKIMIARILLAAVLLVLCSLAPAEGLWRLLLFLVPYLLVGWDILWRAVRNILQGQIFDENFLMALATVGAFAIGEYPEGVFVMVFYQAGELFQDRAVDKSRESIAALMDIMPEYANLEQEGTLHQVPPEEVAVGQVIVIKPGEKIPLDGRILEGASSLNTVALTGEAAPRDVAPGDELVSGCVNLVGLLRVEVTRRFEDSTVSKILELVETSAASKAKTEKFITRFARYYTPIVVLAALGVAVIPPLFFSGGWQDWVYRALSFLVISCPCALVLSVPLSFFGGVGGASRRGILVKGASYLERLAKAEIVAFDKTGTLTKGTFIVNEILPEPGWTKESLLAAAAGAEAYSDHPIAQSLRVALGDPVDIERVTDTRVLAGLGVAAIIDGREVLVGNARLMEESIPGFTARSLLGTVVHVAVEGRYAGCILIADVVKENAKETIKRLARLGVEKTVMLTGDSRETGEAVARELSLDGVFSQLLPQDKVGCVEALLGETGPKGSLVFVGDGINDAPVLSRADVGIAMGAFGSDAAIEAADVVLMEDDLEKVVISIKIAKKTMAITWQNIAFSLGIKALVMLFAFLGLTNMWHAIMADVGVCVVAVLNATRTLHTDSY